MKTSTREQREKTVGLLLMASFILVIALAVVGFVSSLKGLVDKRTDYMLVDAVQQYGTTFSDSIECKLSAVSTVADILSNMKADDMEQIYSTLAKIAFKEHFYTVALSNTAGQTITNRRDTLNIANQEYFIRAKDGESVVSDAMKSPIDETPVLILSVPIYNHRGVSGVLSCSYELSQLEQITAKPRYFGEAYGMIFSEKGEVISWEQHKNSLGVNQSVDQIFGNCKMFGGMTAEMLHSNMENRMSGSFSIEFMGSKRLVCYMPLEINNWYAFCFAPFTVYNRETADVGRIVALLVIELVLGLGMLFCYILYSNYRHSKLLGAANIKYEAILSNICGGVEVTTFAKAIEEVELIYASAGFTEITGYTLEDFRLKWGGQLYHHIYEKDREAVSRMLRKVSSDNPEYNVEYRIVHKDGHIVWVMDRGKLIENEEDAFQCHSVLTDISEIKRQQEKLSISEERFRIAIESADNMMFDYDSINCVYVDFANSVHMMGKTKEQINADLEYTHVLTERERTAEISKYFYHPDDLATVMQQSSIGLESGDVYFDARVHCANDRYVWCRIHLTIINNVDGIPYRVLGFMGNIDVVKRQAELFRAKSEKDALTGFYNKAATVSLVNNALDSDLDIPYTLFVMDIDNFKTINDTMGHIAGDAVIAEASERIRAIFRSDDIIGRVGGDEFIVLIRGVSEVEHIIHKAKEIIDAFNTMSINAGGFFNVSISIGIEICTERSNYEKSFIRADKALYSAKRSGKNKYIFYDETLSESDCHTCNDAP